jgi:hypothetical protein
MLKLGAVLVWIAFASSAAAESTADPWRKKDCPKDDLLCMGANDDGSSSGGSGRGVRNHPEFKSNGGGGGGAFKGMVMDKQRN